MLNIIWVAMLLGAVLCGAVTGRLDAVAQASTESAGKAVELAIGLVGVMALWLGMMRVLQEGGLLRAMARGLGPIMRRLFPEVPKDHPAMSMMILNLVSNALGLANAATPFGLKAMMELERLNPHPGTATNAMALFLAINTSNVAILPTGIIALRASLGSNAPGSIFMTTLIATSISTLVAVVVTIWLARMAVFRLPAAPQTVSATCTAPTPPDTLAAEALVSKQAPGATVQARVVAWLALLALLAAFGYALYQKSLTPGADNDTLGWAQAARSAVEQWPLVLLMVAIVMFGMLRGVKVYDAVVEGGKEGFQVALRIIPYLVAMLVAVGMLRASGALDLLAQGVGPLTELLGMPPETLPMALLRPLSGSGAYAVAAEIMQAHGADSLIGQIVSTMQGSTETTFYVLALYYGSVGVRTTRHTVPALLTVDVVGPLVAVWACRLLLS